MKTRCYNVKAKDYKNYGLRGIKICDEWLNDSNLFIEWSLNNGYQVGLTIDRIDTNGNYEPNNCRWITSKEQQSNKRNNKLITINGETKTLSQWAEKSGLSRHVIFERIKMKWDNDDLLKPLKIEVNLITINGQTKTISEWSEISGIKIKTIVGRISYGWDNEDLLLPTSKVKYKDRRDRFGVS